MALAMETTGATAQDTDLMDIDIDMDIDEHGPAIDDEFQLEVGRPLRYLKIPSHLARKVKNLISNPRIQSHKTPQT